jgi:hypothetical protein
MGRNKKQIPQQNGRQVSLAGIFERLNLPQFCPLAFYLFWRDADRTK